MKDSTVDFYFFKRKIASTGEFITNRKVIISKCDVTEIRNRRHNILGTKV